jgi:hypothetical protein
MFEPAVVLHALDHYRAADNGYWCWCYSQEHINHVETQIDMFIRGYNADKAEDVERYKADHYGKHDRKQLGMNAVSCAIVPERRTRHRCDDEFYLLDWTGPIPQDGSFVLCDTGYYSMGQHGTLRLYRALVSPTRP